MLSALLAAARFVAEWRDASGHLPRADPRVRRGWRLGAAAGACALAGCALHFAAIGSDWPFAVFGCVLGLYAAALLCFVLAHRLFVRLAPPDELLPPSR